MRTNDPAAGEGVAERLRSAWLGQLRAEFEDICFQYRVVLRTPVFELNDSRTRLGSWSEQDRMISISAHLISSRSWKITLQVLKHEMAHQICSEILGAPDHGHGPMFQRACSMLGLSGVFCRAAADSAKFLDRLEPEGLVRTRAGRRILDRVEKLLALAGSDNEHEAALAMQRAGELLGRHNLALSSADDGGTYRTLSLNTGRQRMPGYLREICSLLQGFFFVKVVCASVYDPEKNVRLRTIELFGRPENVAVAEHCYTFLSRKLITLWEDNRHRFPAGRQRARNSYMRGVVVGFREKLAAAEQQRPSGSIVGQAGTSALAVAEDLGLQRFIAEHFPRLRSVSGRRLRLHADAYREAVATGKTLVLHRAMEERSSGGGLLEG